MTDTIRKGPTGGPPVPAGWVLRLALLSGVFGLFAGQAWLFFRGQVPVFALLQSEDVAKPLVERFLGIDWGTWVSDPAIHALIMGGVRVVAWFFVICAVSSLALVVVPTGRPALKRVRVIPEVVMLAGTAVLCVLAWMQHLDHGGIAFHFLEYATQCVIPVVFVVVVRQAWRTRPGSFVPWLGRVALALTFTIHGLYAIGFEVVGSSTLVYSLPGGWVEMTVSGLGKLAALGGWDPPGEEAATAILQVAGILDLLAAVAVLLPWVGNLGLIYMVAWGLLTALARTWSNYLPDFAGETLSQWIPETLIRLPHFSLPMFILALGFRLSESPDGAPLKSS